MGVRQLVFAEDRASVEENGNRVWSRHDICRPQFQPRYRDRYAFAPARGQSWQCQYDPYPRDWWAQDDGWYGDPYQDYAYGLDGWDRYNQGYGWYDQNGRYIDDSRYLGDARWNRGGRRGIW
ncbi:hypothetical protein [Brevundimonas denitrificans]|uniref:hypothetical protein n=1 Tax=Brevundimonas denitrificans TaxID=1443434 RepID=UPI00223ACAB2|nr:hypothetical protein [Brevundimonas denitrificans]